jgi:hypothetical protein
MSKKTSSRDQLQQRAQTEISQRLAALREREAVDLARLVESPEESEIRQDSLVASMTAWARQHPSGKLGVIVEAREARLGGMMHSVSADGFYVHPDGSIEPMKEEDLWDHGY